RITVFLEQEYANQALSLSLLSERFDLSEAYLSHLFKEQTGENFSACLERIRMNRAHTLLSTTDLPVDVIAERIGYNSGDTFRRAFRRFHGITPGAYRNSTRQE
ncbi:MAG: AraC family transcriptional regulator, partial [Eubacteriales bacterium]|nr:AraC family transcriptional regulator [Eubacteriales bacterium]